MDIAHGNSRIPAIVRDWDKLAKADCAASPGLGMSGLTPSTGPKQVSLIETHYPYISSLLEPPARATLREEIVSLPLQISAVLGEVATSFSAPEIRSYRCTTGTLSRRPSGA